MMTNQSTQRARRVTWATLFIAGFALAACGQQGSSQTATATAAAPAATTPAATATPATLKIYNTTCHTCHSSPASGAPQLGDSKAWAPRIAQGKDTVIDHAINGYKGMPPMGMCMQCTEDDFIALTEYMSGAKLQ